MISRAALARLTLSTEHYEVTHECDALQQKYRRDRRQRALRQHHPDLHRSNTEAAKVEDGPDVTPVVGPAGAPKAKPKRQRHLLAKDVYVAECEQAEKEGRGLDDEEREGIREFFESMTKKGKGGGSVTKKDLRAAMEQYHLADRMLIERLFHLLDLTGTGSIGFAEFEKILRVILRGPLEAQVFCAFQVYRLSNALDDDRVEVLTREDMFRHLKLETDSNIFLAPDFRALFRVFEEKTLAKENRPALEKPKPSDVHVTLDEFRATIESQTQPSCGFSNLFRQIVTGRQVLATTSSLTDAAAALRAALPALLPAELAQLQTVGLQELKEMFSKMDGDKDGLIGLQDLVDGGLTVETARDVLQRAAEGESLGFEDFAQVFVRRKIPMLRAEDE